MNHKTLALTLIALLSAAPIVCAPASRYNNLLNAQKNRELTSDEKEELQRWEQLKQLGTQHSEWREKEYVSGIQLTLFWNAPINLGRSGGPSWNVKREIIGLNGINDQHQPNTISTEFGSVVVNGLIKEEDAPTEKIMPLEKDLFAPIISGYGPIWECNGRRYSRIQHVSTYDWKVIVEGPLEPLDACNQESNNNNNADKHITLTASLIAVHAQTDGVNYERLAKSLE